MRVVISTERDTFTVSNVIDWFHGVDSSLVVLSKFEDGKETIRRCWRNWVYFDVVTREDEKPEEQASNSEQVPKTVQYAVGDKVVSFEID